MNISSFESGDIVHCDASLFKHVKYFFGLDLVQQASDIQSFGHVVGVPAMLCRTVGLVTLISTTGSVLNVSVV